MKWWLFRHRDSFQRPTFICFRRSCRSPLSAKLRRKALSKADEKTGQRESRCMAELAKTQSLIATKLRLVPSARIGPRTAGRTHDAHRP